MPPELINRTATRLTALLALLTLLGGCASFGEGLSRGVLSSFQASSDADNSACEVSGAAFEGIEGALQAQDGQGVIGETPSAKRSVVKVMMVHGIGSHHPGYSGRTTANLTAALGLDVHAPQVKSINIPSTSDPATSLGTLTLQRFSDNALERELLVYELTWSRISDPARANLRFDTSQVHSRNRARLNQVGKGFVNDVLVDPLVYVGVGHDQILSSVRQGLCWVYSTDWDGFPTQPDTCGGTDPRLGSRVQQDKFFFVTHSLGSKILLEALESTAQGLTAQQDTNPQAIPFRTALQNHTPTVFMLANQLPLLQAGFPPPPVNGQIDAYCKPSGEHFGQRMVANTKVVAFSDPNDLLSYSIPEGFVRNGIDSRLCPQVVNVTLNIAQVSTLFSGDGFANPLTAHSEYNNDERVIGLMTNGLGQDETLPVVKERCHWTRTEESLR
jgi:hypothetical protein